MENIDSTDRSQEYDYDDNKASPSLIENNSLNADLKVLELGSLRKKEIPRCLRVVDAETQRMKQLQERERIRAQEQYAQQMQKLTDEYLLSLMKPQYIDIEHASLSQVLYAFRRNTSQEEQRSQFTN